RRVFDGHSVFKIVTDPNDADIVYAAVGELQTQGSSGGKGVWKSTNGGRRWMNVTETSLPDGADMSFNDLAIDPSAPSRGFAAGSELNGDADLKGVWATVDGGAHWVRVLTPRELTPLLAPRYATKIAVTPGSPNVVYAASAAAPDPFGEGVGKLSVFKS